MEFKDYSRKLQPLFFRTIITLIFFFWVNKLEIKRRQQNIQPTRGIPQGGQKKEKKKKKKKKGKTVRER